MNLRIPPNITWYTKGLVTEDQKQKLISEAKRQSAFLTKALEFQGLIQGKRRAQVGDFLFTCTSVFGINKVSVHLIKEKKGKILLYPICWCGCQLTFGIITDKIESSLWGIGCAPGDGLYPNCAISDISKFSGLRYRVRLCQKKKWTVFCCTATDFENYETGDSVALLYIGDAEGEWSWDLEDCGKFACKGVIRNKELDTVIDGIDGQFVILPYNLV